MLRYTLQRIVALIITLIIILSIAFLVIRLMPGSIYENAEATMSPELVKVLEAKYHLNDPIIVQYKIFLQNALLKGDWGTSLVIQPKVDVWKVLTSKIPVTLSLNFVALFLALPIGFLAGIIAAIYRNTKIDYIISLIVIVFISVPSFIFATLLQYSLAFKLGWFPIIYDSMASGGAKYISMVLPIMALSFSPIARITRYLRGELIESLNSEYMLLARTKGLTQFQATVRHALRNAFLPLANIIIPMFTNILIGSLVVEKIFAVAGVGGLLVKSINSNDHSLTVAILIFYSVVSLLTILVVDLSYGIIDPRVRVGGGSK